MCECRLDLTHWLACLIYVGDIYNGVDIFSGGEVAIKVERPPGLTTRRSIIKHEYNIYKALAGSTGIPRVHWFGVEGDYNVMVLDLLGPSLEDLFNICNRKFSLRTVLLLADRLVCNVH